MKTTIFAAILIAGLTLGVSAQETLTTQRLKNWGEKTFPVSPGKKLEVRFTAMATGPDTVENDPRIRIRNLHGAGSSVNLEFLDGNNHRIEEVILPVTTQALREHARVLYPPPETAAMRVILAPAQSASLTVEKVGVSQELTGEEAECINPHPVFSHGDLNPYGYLSGFGGGFYERPDGVTVWNTGFTGTSPDFPVVGGATYTATCRGTAYAGRKSRLQLLLFKKGDRQAFHQIPLAFSGGPQSFELPSEAVQARLLAYDVILEAWKITPIPQAKAPKDL